MARSPIDRGKLRVALRKLGRGQLEDLLGAALDLLSEARLAELISDHIDVTPLRTSAPSRKGLLSEVKLFAEDSLRGDYYESFNVNSKNFMDTSEGTDEWLGECSRLFGRCIDLAKSTGPEEAGAALEVLIGLLEHVDEGNDDVIFFADEGGSWQVQVEWVRVIPVWAEFLAETMSPAEFAQRAYDVVMHLVGVDQARHLASLRKKATPDQRKALDSLVQADQNLSSKLAAKL